MNSSNLPNLEVEWVDPRTLTFPNRRVRRHSKKQLRKLRASIAAFG